MRSMAWLSIPCSCQRSMRWPTKLCIHLRLLTRPLSIPMPFSIPIQLRMPPRLPVQQRMFLHLPLQPGALLCFHTLPRTSLRQASLWTSLRLPTQLMRTSLCHPDNATVMKPLFLLVLVCHQRTHVKATLASPLQIGP